MAVARRLGILARLSRPRTRQGKAYHKLHPALTQNTGELVPYVSLARPSLRLVADSLEMEECPICLHCFSPIKNIKTWCFGCSRQSAIAFLCGNASCGDRAGSPLCPVCTGTTVRLKVLTSRARKVKAFAEREWEYAIPSPSWKSSPPALVPTPASRDYSTALLTHAKLYVWATNYTIPSLAQLVIHKVYHTLLHLKLYPATYSSIVGAIVHVFRNTYPGDGLRDLLASFCACNLRDLGRSAGFRKLPTTAPAFWKEIQEASRALLARVKV